MSRELTPQETAERSLIKTYRKSIWNPFIAAVKRYELIEPGRRNRQLEMEADVSEQAAPVFARRQA